MTRVWRRGEAQHGLSGCEGGLVQPSTGEKKLEGVSGGALHFFFGKISWDMLKNRSKKKWAETTESARDELSDNPSETC